MKNLDAIYFAARELPSADRPDFLAQACAGDDDLQKRVKQMLAVSAEAEAFITDLPDDDSEDRPPANGSAKALKLDLADAPDEAVGQTLGRYKLLERVGEGGCGVVYVAEQTEPVRRRVALKVIKLGMDTKQVVARFEAERQALAMMDHPNIAKIFDAGVTGAPVAAGVSPAVEPGVPPGGTGVEDSKRAESSLAGPGGKLPPSTAGETPAATLSAGRPFFVMELVRGIKITDYCDQANLTTRERLDLFIKVCQAIQHAHQKGIIHRDIKPSNILVTLHDGVPVPKVIDFGIAKATEGRLTDATVYTQLHQFIGTPAYMSPEQAEMSGLDMDTRSDIYSLGVLLYELLAGSTPFDAKELMASGIDAMRKTIREQEPQRPSTKLTQALVAAEVTRGTAGHDEPSASSRRRLQEVVHQLQGDLDWIVMKCLEKDRTRRYETANGLAADIQRHLKNEPVVARPPSTAYRIQKAWQRNKLAFTTATAVAVALVVGISISVWQATVAIRAKNQAMLAEAGKEQEARIAKQERDAAKAATLRADEQAESNRRNLYAADMVAAQIAVQRMNYGATRQLLDRHVPGANQQDLRGFEWRLLWQQIGGDQLRTLQGHTGVVCVAFSPDGKYLLSGSQDGSVVVWDVSSGRKLNSWLAQGSGVNGVSFSPDAKLVATGGRSGSIKLWQWPEMILQTTFTNLGGYAEFDRVKMRLFTGFGITTRGGGSTNIVVALVNLLSAAGPEHVVQFKTAPLAFPAASPQGDLVAVGSPGADVQLLDLDGHLLRSLDESKGAVSIAFSPKADLLAVCSGIMNGRWSSRPENEIRVHDPATGRRFVSLTNHTGGVSSLAFSPDGRWLASASSDQTVRLWEAATWREANRFQGHGSGVRTVAFSPDGKLVASGGSDVRLWKADRADSANRVDDAFVRFGGNPAPRFLNGESMFAAQLFGANRRHAGIWSVQSGKLLHEFPTNELLCLGENAKGTAILTLDRSRNQAILKFWDTHDFHLLKEVTLLEATDQIGSVSLTSDRRSVLVTQPERTLEVDCETGEIRKEISLPTGMGVSIRFSPDRRCWAAFDRETPDYRMGATAESSEGIRLSGHQDAIYYIAFSPTENIVATASMDKTARLWEWPNGRQLAVLAGHKESLFHCDFSPDGRTLATASGDKTVKLWNVSTGREVMTLEHDHPVAVCVFSPEGNYLATGTVNGSYHFWRAAQWDEIKDAEALNKKEDVGP